MEVATKVTTGVTKVICAGDPAPYWLKFAQEVAEKPDSFLTLIYERLQNSLEEFNRRQFSILATMLVALNIKEEQQLFQVAQMIGLKGTHGRSRVPFFLNFFMAFFRPEGFEREFGDSKIRVEIGGRTLEIDSTKFPSSFNCELYPVLAFILDATLPFIDKTRKFFLTTDGKDTAKQRLDKYLGEAQRDMDLLRALLVMDYMHFSNTPEGSCVRLFLDRPPIDYKGELKWFKNLRELCAPKLSSPLTLTGGESGVDQWSLGVALSEQQGGQEAAGAGASSAIAVAASQNPPSFSARKSAETERVPRDVDPRYWQTLKPEDQQAILKALNL